MKYNIKRIARGTLTIAVASFMVIQGVQVKISAASNAQYYYRKESKHSALSSVWLRLANMSRDSEKIIGASQKDDVEALNVSQNDSVKLGMSFSGTRHSFFESTMKFTLTLAEGIVIDTSVPLYISRGPSSLNKVSSSANSTDFIMPWGVGINESLVYNPETNTVNVEISTKRFAFDQMGSNWNQYDFATLWISGSITSTSAPENNKLPANLKIEMAAPNGPRPSYADSWATYSIGTTSWFMLDDGSYVPSNPGNQNPGDSSQKDAKELKKLARILDNQIFTDKTHTALRNAGLERQLIAMTREALSKLSEGSEKDFLNAELDRAESMLDSNGDTTPNPDEQDHSYDSDEGRELVRIMKIIDNFIFTSKEHKTLRNNGIERELIEVLRKKLSQLPDSGDKTYLISQLDKADEILGSQNPGNVANEANEIERIYSILNSKIFTNKKHSELRRNLVSQFIAIAREKLSKLSDSSDKEYIKSELDRAERMLAGNNVGPYPDDFSKETMDLKKIYQILNEYIFTDEKHTTLRKTGVERQLIDITREKISNLPDSETKVYLSEELNRAEQLLSQIDTEKPDGTNTHNPGDSNSGNSFSSYADELLRIMNLIDGKIFTNKDHTALRNGPIRQLIGVAKNDLSKLPNSSYKDYLNAELDRAERMINGGNGTQNPGNSSNESNEMLKILSMLNSRIFANKEHTALRSGPVRQFVSLARESLAKLSSCADKDYLNAELDKAEQILDAQQSVEDLYSDSEKKIVKPEIDQIVIDETQTVVDKMPEGPAKDQVQKDLDNAKVQVDSKYQVAAKGATEKLFIDESHTSLADNVDQKAIDDAQQANDKVSDKDVKAKGQQAIDQAQKLLKAQQAVEGLFTDATHTALKPETSQEAVEAVKTQVSELAEGSDKAAFVKELETAQNLLDGQQAIEKLFSDTDKQVVKPDVDQKTIDEVQSVVNKMPEGQAKDQAQKNLDTVRSQVEQKNQGAAKGATEKLFIDESHTSLADNVDQKAIDDAQQANDKVSDKDVKAKGQQAIDQAQKLLKAQQAVEGLFTDATHTALKPETSQEAVEAVKTQVSELAEGSDKAAFVKELETAQNLLDGQQAIEKLFSDTDKQVVKPDVDQKTIDEVQSVVNKMPEGQAKDQAQKNLDTVRSQVEQKNQGAAKGATEKLFIDESHTSLADNVDQKAIDDAQQANDKVSDKDVKAKGQQAIDQAQKLLNAQQAVEGLFTDATHTALKPETNQEVVEAVKTQVSELAEGSDKAAFVKELETAQNLLDGQQAIEKLFSDTDKQVVKPDVDQKTIDEVQSVVNKMPEGQAKDQAQKNLDTVRSQVEQKNQGAAKGATEKLFIDESHTSLADNVDQKAIDDAQQANDKVSDKDVKAKGQQAIDQAQKLLNAQQAVEGLFTDATHTALKPETSQEAVEAVKTQVSELAEGSDKAAFVKELETAQNLLDGQQAIEKLFSDTDKQVVKPDVDQKTIDEVQSVVNKMPEGQAKDQAQKNLDTVRSQVEQKNQGAAKGATEKLFIDESHTSLADNVDQKAIDDAQQANDKVSDKDVKAKGQQAIDQAQKLLNAQQAVEGLFTDATHTALKPETSQEAVEAVKTQVSELAEGSDKAAFVKELETAQNLLDGQQAIEKLFSDTDKQVVKPDVDQKTIDEVQSVVNKMPEGQAKDQAQKNLDTVRSQVEQKNQGAAKGATEKLFIDESHTSLADNVDQKAIDDAQQANDKVSDKDVKAKGQQAIDQAQKLLKAQQAVEGLFTDATHTALKPETNQEVVEAVKTQVSELAEGSDKAAFVKELETAQNLLDGQQAIEKLFSDTDKQVVKPDVDQKTIDEVQSVVNKMPEGQAKDQAQKNLDTVRSQVEQKNQGAAKGATEKLFIDESHTSLADNVDQKAIDNAQVLVDKVGDAEVKATDQKAIDNAQNILNVQKKLEGFFTDSDKESVKPGIDKRVIDETQAMIDKMPEGPAKDQAQKDLNNVRELIEGEIQEAVQATVEKLFIDLLYDTLADATDQKAIDNAQKVLDKVKDGEFKSDLQIVIGKAQRLLNGKYATEGLFTDKNKTTLKPKIDQKVIDAVETVVNKMPGGLGREQAEEALAKAKKMFESNHQAMAKEAIDKLFKDESRTSLADNVDQKAIDNAQVLVDKVGDAEVKATYQKAIDNAQNILNVQKKLEGFFTDSDKESVKPGIDKRVIDETQVMIDKMPEGPAKDQAQKDLDNVRDLIERKIQEAVQATVEKLFIDLVYDALADATDQKAIDNAQKVLDKVKDGEFKSDLQTVIGEAQLLLNGKYATEGLFTDKNRTTLKPKIDQKVIDEVEAVVNKMPGGLGREQAEEALAKAKEMFERNNQTMAKEAIDKLFKDESRTSLADNVDQKAIDNAQVLVDKVGDAEVKATDQKAIDNAQNILNVQKKLEGFFTDSDKESVKPGIDKRVIDETQAMIDKMPEGPAKDQAQKDLDNVRELIEGEIQEAVQATVEKLFIDLLYDTLADATDQKAIDNAQKVLDKVKDGEFKSDLQIVIGKAQRLLNGKYATEGLFTDKNKTTLKPKIDQKVIDGVESVVNKMPGGLGREQAEEALAKAKEMFERNNQTMAKEATDKLFKDTKQTILAGNVNQLVIDKAQKMVNQVRDANANADLQKVVDKAQRIFDGKQAVNELFNNKIKKQLKTNVDNKVVDEVQKIIENMPIGPEKDQANKDLDIARSKVAIINQLSAKKAINKLFKDDTQTSLAEGVDQKTIDEVRKIVDSVYTVSTQKRLNKMLMKAQRMFDEQKK